ncbi:MAG: hypothetical protein JW700_00380 [Candidatus Aenigmarchaeota archaeon]|nr:hypothetical protein [Candidatus Aenigmarchaeota archaeon]
MSGFASYHPSIDSGINGSVRKKMKETDDLYQAFKDAVGVRNIFSRKRKQKNLQKTQDYFEKIGKSKDLEHINKVEEKIANMASDPRYSSRQAQKQREQERIKKENDMKELERENNRQLLRERIYNGLNLVKVEKKKKLGFIPSYETTFDLESGYEDLFKNATIKTDKYFVHSEMARMEKEETNPKKKLKLTGLKKTYAKKEKVHRKKIWSGIFLGLTAGMVGTAFAIDVLNNNNNKELDSDGDGIPDYKDPEPFVYNNPNQNDNTPVYNEPTQNNEPETVTNPVVQYAEGKGLSKSVIDTLKVLGDDGDMSQSDKALVDTVSYVGSSLIPSGVKVYYTDNEIQDIQNDIIHSVLSDGKVGSVETEAMSKLPNERWYVVKDIIDAGMVNDVALSENWDGSGPSNIEEIRQGTNPLNDLEDVPGDFSDRYAVLVETLGSPGAVGRVLGTYHLLKKNGYSDDKINLSIKLSPEFEESDISLDRGGLASGLEWLKEDLKGNLIHDYKTVIDHRDGEITPITISSWIKDLNSDGNDSIFIYHNGHGGQLGSGEELNNALNLINYKNLLILNDSCSAEGLVKSLNGQKQLKNVVAIASSSEGEDVGSLFSDSFLPLVKEGLNVDDAYESAKKIVLNEDLREQNPVIYSFDTSINQPKNSKLPWLSSFNFFKYIKK